MATRSSFAFVLFVFGLAGCGTPTPPAPKKIEWVTAPSGPVAPIVKSEEARAQREGRRVLVYVGATWCEPCRRFHEAVKSGQLDEQFGQLRFVEFDLDRDNERLAEAGYMPKMIPLLAVPDAEGLATAHRMEGSIKGAGAVAQMAPRLRALLAN
jgi:thiol-disulfide isomerase/thioredoxin